MSDEDSTQARFIRDNAGRRYRVELLGDSPHWQFRVYDGAVRVGLANCRHEGPVLILADIEIRDEVMHREGSVKGLLRMVLSRPPQCSNYRSRGIGSALLRLITEWARERGFTSIEGSLSSRDLDRNPGLADWYRHRGFIVASGGTYGSGKIELRLPPSL
jgi:GNAT superfamily N-acetyltransferase